MRGMRAMGGPVLAGTCWAFAAGAAETLPPDDPAVRELPEITVTAQKTEQSLQDVPASVSSLDGELVRRSGAFGLPDLQSYAPNIEISLTPTTSDIYVRGFGTASTNAGFEPSVGSVVDGVFYGRSNFLSAFFFDLDRIEVLRGPQGTLFGKNSTAGILNVVTAPPEPDFGAQVEVLYGDYGERSLRPVVSMPLLEGWSMRVSGNYSTNSGLLHNTKLDRAEANVDQTSTRLRLRYGRGGNGSLDIGAFTSTQHMNNGLFQLSHLVDDMLDLIQQYDPLAEGRADNFLNSNNVPADAQIRFSGASATVDYGLEQWIPSEKLALTSITAWAELVMNKRDIDADFSPVPVIRDSLIEPSPFRQLSEELRLAGKHDTFWGWGHGVEYVLGAYFYDASFYANDRFALEDLGAAFAYLTAARSGNSGMAAPTGSTGGIAGQIGGPLGQIADLLSPALRPTIGDRQEAIVQLSQDTRAYALFGQLEHRFTETWSLLGGLRLGREDKEGLASSEALGRLIPLIADQKDHVTPLARSEREISPKFGLKWQPAEKLDFYGTWSRGYKSGGFNALPLTDTNLQFEPERASSWEAGVKARLLEGSMRMSAALFDTDFENLQVSTFKGASFIILNAAAARSRGMEMDLHWLPPIAGTSIMATLGYIDAKYTSYPNAPGYADAEGPFDPANCNAADFFRCPPTQDLTGQRLAISTRWNASLIPSFTMLLPGGVATAVTALDVLYRSDRYLDVDLDPRTYQPATTEVNLRLSVAGTRTPWELTLAGRNLTDEVMLEQVLDQPLAPGNFAAIRGDRGRFYSANISFGF